MLVILLVNSIVQCLFFFFNYYIWFSFFEFLNWNIISLKCCGIFCCITLWISHMYTFISTLLSLPPTFLFYHSRSSQSIELSSLCYTTDSILHITVYIGQCYFLSSSPFSFLVCVHRSTPYVCASIPVLQID